MHRGAAREKSAVELGKLIGCNRLEYMSIFELQYNKQTGYRTDPNM